MKVQTKPSDGAGRSVQMQQAKTQAESTRSRRKKKKEDINMTVWLRLPQELMWEVLRFVVADFPDYRHRKCLTRCVESTLDSKRERKKKYEGGHLIDESEFTFIEDRLACPIWGIGHLSQVHVSFMMHHCQYSLPSHLHQTLIKPSKVTIGQVTLIDEGVRFNRRLTMYSAKVVIKDFGNAKYEKVKPKENNDDDSDDDWDEVRVCYHDGFLQDIFKNTCGKVTHCRGGIEEGFGLDSLEQYWRIDIDEDRACEDCAEHAEHARCRGDSVL